MRIRVLNSVAMAIIGGCLLWGCASTPAPHGWLSIPEKTQQEAYGAWIIIEYKTNISGARLYGEFISAADNSVFVLASRGLVSIPEKDIKSAQLAIFESRYGTISKWTLLGTISALSHGLVGIISMPVWILTGTLASIGQSHAPIKKYPSYSWDDLKMYARFPQGIPPGLDRSQLRMKPLQP
jgi:hypothetical protein